MCTFHAIIKQGQYMEKDPYSEYIKHTYNSNNQGQYIWSTAIGLQQVDGLKTSAYLNELASKNICGDITLDKTESLIHSYYAENINASSSEEEADKVAVNIARVLNDNSFILSPAQYIGIHRDIFHNIFPHAGKIRTYNISKKEWVLDGDSVIYAGSSLLSEALEYDFEQEKQFSYDLISEEKFIEHIADFISRLWQIHAFEEGNTRATAVFLIKYLKTFGFDVTNDTFRENSWYFRNALVRANYSNISKGIFGNNQYLILFLRNLILNEQNELKNRYLHINWISASPKTSQHRISSVTNSNYLKLCESLSKSDYFGRTDIISVLNLSQSGASKLIAKLLNAELIEPVKGFGKGKYRFK